MQRAKRLDFITILVSRAERLPILSLNRQPGVQQRMIGERLAAGRDRHSVCDRASGIRDRGPGSVTGEEELATLDRTEPAPAAGLLPNHADLPDAGGQDPIAELQMQATGRNDIGPDHTAAPGASRDRDPNRRQTLAVEPASADAVGGVFVDMDRVDGVLRGHQDFVSALQLRLSDGRRATDLPEDGVHRPKERDHWIIPGPSSRCSPRSRCEPPGPMIVYFFSAAGQLRITAIGGGAVSVASLFTRKRRPSAETAYCPQGFDPSMLLT